MTDTTRIVVSRILNIGRSPSGVHYKKAELQKLADSINANERGVFATFNQTKNEDYTDLSLVAAIINKAYVDDTGLIIEQRILDTPSGQKLTEVLDAEKERAQRDPYEEFFSAIVTTPIVVGVVLRQGEFEPDAKDLQLKRVSNRLVDDK